MMEWNAQNYQSTCGRVTEHGAKLVDVLRKNQCGRILDLGCGTGVLTNEIAGFSDEVVGIDLSSAMVEKARSMYPGIEFKVMDACALEWENYFDAVFSNAVLHFIKTQDILLDNIRKALTDNGLFICEFGASGNIIDLLYAVEQACVNRGKAYSLRFYYPTEEE
jgi:trans-aconitate methyltransferase